MDSLICYVFCNTSCNKCCGVYSFGWRTIDRYMDEISRFITFIQSNNIKVISLEKEDIICMVSEDRLKDFLYSLLIFLIVITLILAFK